MTESKRRRSNRTRAAGAHLDPAQLHQLVRERQAFRSRLGWTLAGIVLASGALLVTRTAHAAPHDEGHVSKPAPAFRGAAPDARPPGAPPAMRAMPPAQPITQPLQPAMPRTMPQAMPQPLPQGTVRPMAPPMGSPQPFARPAAPAMPPVATPAPAPHPGWQGPVLASPPRVEPHARVVVAPPPLPALAAHPIAPHAWGAPAPQPGWARLPRGYPQPGLRVPVLGPGHTRFAQGGALYYQDAGVWYQPIAEGYVVVAPPAWANGGEYATGPDDAGAAPAFAAVGELPELTVLPLAEQSASQYYGDRSTCSLWASAQSGFEPGRGSAADPYRPQRALMYRDAEVACLRSRGYDVR
jgi:hypothetical protein